VVLEDRLHNLFHFLRSVSIRMHNMKFVCTAKQWRKLQNALRDGVGSIRGLILKSEKFSRLELARLPNISTQIASRKSILNQMDLAKRSGRVFGEA